MPVWQCCSLFCSRGIDLETGGDAFCIVNNDENPFSYVVHLPSFISLKHKKPLVNCRFSLIIKYNPCFNF